MLNKKSRRIVSAGVLMALLLSSMNVYAGSLEDQISWMESTQAEMESQKEEALELCEELKSEIEELNKSIEKYQIEIDIKQEELDSLEEDYNEALLEKEERYETVRNLLSNADSNDRDIEKILFRFEKNSKLMNRSKIVQGLSSSDKDILKAYLDLCEEIRQEEKGIEEEKKELEDLQKPYNEEKERLQSLIEEKESDIAYLETELGINNESLRQLKAELEAYNAAMALRESIRQGLSSGDGSLKGMFINPCPDGYLCSDYGYREDGFHKGIDLKCSTGSPIYAAYDGVVTISGVSSSAGNWIVVDHGNGLVTKYMHCSERYVSAGDTVTQGQKIAAVGSTGNSTTPHLHFQVEFDGVSYSPWSFL